MPYSSHITVKNSFIGIHKWSGCPHEEVSFLKTVHRHVFHVHTKLPVNHDDRDLEFFMVQREVYGIIRKLYGFETVHLLGDRSCEMIAKEIVKELQTEYPYIECIRVIVSEDGENSASVTWSQD
jgi:hypothetical protein